MFGTKLARGWRGLSRGVFMVNCLAIVYQRGKVLIGRRVSDPYIKTLTWGFPGGRPAYKTSLEVSLTNEVRKKTGIKIDVLGLHHASLFRLRPSFLLLYYLAVPTGGELQSGEKFSGVKWVAPNSVQRYFTTPIDHETQLLLNGLAASSEELLHLFDRASTFEDVSFHD